MSTKKLFTVTCLVLAVLVLLFTRCATPHIPMQESSPIQVSAHPQDQAKEEQPEVQDLPVYPLFAAVQPPQGALDIKDALWLHLDTEILEEWLETRPQAWVLPLPDIEGVPTSLVLTPTRGQAMPEVNIAEERISPSMAEGELGWHFSGYVMQAGEKKRSLVAVSVFENQITGLISLPSGDYNLGAVSPTAEITGKFLDYIWYRGDGLSSLRPLGGGRCSTPTGAPSTPLLLNEVSDRSLQDNVLRAFFSIDYTVYNKLGKNKTLSLQYVYALVNQLTAVFAQEQIDFRLSEVFIRTEKLPYEETIDNIENNLLENRNKKNGDVGVYLVYLPSYFGGGRARGDICKQGFPVNCVSYVGASGVTFPVFPLYSEEVRTTAHEIGHLLGSAHTHDCQWGGQALDNCGNNGGLCSPGPPPGPEGGTIMSYCYMESLLNGFGALPGGVIRNTITEATCVQTKTIAALCKIDTVITYTECLPDPNPNLATDNAFTIKMRVLSGSSSGGTWTAKIGSTIQTFPYNTEVSLGNFLSYKGEVGVTIYDTADPSTCESFRVFAPPYSCNTMNQCYDQVWRIYNDSLAPIANHIPVRTEGLHLSRMIKAPDGNLLYLQRSAFSGSNMAVVKLTQSGQVLWRKNLDIGAVEPDPTPGGQITTTHEIAVTNDGQIGILVRALENGRYVMKVAKLSPSGELLWTKSLLEVVSLPYAQSCHYVGSIIATPTGGFVICGGLGFIHNYTGDGGAFFVELSFDGTITQIRTPTGIPIATHFDKICRVPNNDYMVIGQRVLPDGFGGFDDHILLMRFDASLNTIWEKTYNLGLPKNFRYALKGADILPMPDGGCLVLIRNGIFAIYPSEGAIVARFDANGNLLWRKLYGGNFEDGIVGAGNHDVGFALAASQDGNFYAAGGSGSASGYAYGQDTLARNIFRPWLLKFDADGKFLSQKTFSGREYQNSIPETYSFFDDIVVADDGGVILSGMSNYAKLDIRKLSGDKCNPVILGPCQPDLNVPVFSNCPPSVTVTASGDSTSYTWTAPMATDDCPGAITVTSSKSPGSMFPLGSTVIKYTALDGGGNAGLCTFSITVQSGGSTGVCAGNLLQNSSFENSLNNWIVIPNTLNINPQVVNDAYSGTKAIKICGSGTYIKQTLGVLPNKTYALSAYTKRDAIKPHEMMVRFFDQQSGVIQEHKATVNSSVYGLLSIDPIVSPAGAVFAEVYLTCKSGSSCFTVDDVCFKEKSSTPPSGCSPDVMAPTLSACPNNITLTTTTTSAVASWTAPAASDNCSPAPVVTGSHASGNSFLLGTTTVVYTAKDAANNTKTCSFSIVVSSAGGGSTCANNLLQNASFESNLTSWSGTGGTIITSGAHSGSNALRLCTTDGKIHQTLSVQVGKTYAFSGFAKADVGKSASLRIKYLTSSFTPISQQSVNIMASTSYIPVSVSMLAPLGAAFAELTILSANGTGCVTVDALCFSEGGITPPPSGCSPDVTPPTLSACPSNITLPIGTTIATWIAPTATDNCSPAPTVTGSHTSGSSFPTGTTTVVYTAKDAANNTKTCSFTILVSSQGATNYCTSTSAAPWSEYISSVKVGNTVKTSGKSVYSNFTATSFLMGKAAANALELQATYSFTTYDEYWKVWIDYNKNNVFEEPSEVVLQQVMTKPASASGVKKILQASINVPSTAINGSTRMRVSMKRGSYAMPCESLPFGEVEDYTVQIASSVLNVQLQGIIPGAVDVAQLPDFVLYPNPAGEYVRVMLHPWKGNEAQLSIINQLGVEVVSKTANLSQAAEVEFDLSQFMNGMYFVKLSCAGYRDVYKKLVVGRGY